MKSPTVSVVVASYNHEKYVADSLQSVLDQTYQDFEVVIVDDGSTDGTVRATKRIADPRIKQVFLNQNPLSAWRRSGGGGLRKPDLIHLLLLYRRRG